MKQFLFPKNRRQGGFIVLMCIGIFLRIYALGKNDLWFDELLTFHRATYSTGPFIFRACLSRWWEAPLYPLLMKGWLKLFYPSEFLLRLPSALFSIGILLMGYLLAKKLFNARVAFITLMIMSVSPFHVWFAQEARYHSFIALWGILSTYFLWGFLQGEHKKRNLLLYIVFSTLNLYTHEFAVPFILAQAVAAAVLARQRVKSTLVVLSPFLFFLPCIIPFLKKVLYIKGGFWTKTPTAFSLSLAFETFILGYYGTWFLHMATRVLNVGLLGTVAINLCRRTDQKRELVFCVLLGFLPVIASYLFSKYIFSIFHIKHFLVSSPYFYIIIAWALIQLKRRWIRWLLIFFLLFSAGISNFRYFSNQADPLFIGRDLRAGVFRKKPYKPLARYIRANLAKDNYIVSSNLIFEPLEYYLRVYYVVPEEQVVSYKLLVLLQFSSLWPARTYAELYDESDPRLATPERFIAMIKDREAEIFFVGGTLMRDGTMDKHSLAVKRYLDQKLMRIHEQSFDGLWLFVYQGKREE